MCKNVFCIKYPTQFVSLKKKSIYRSNLDVKILRINMNIYMWSLNSQINIHFNKHYDVLLSITGSKSLCYYCLGSCCLTLFYLNFVLLSILSFSYNFLNLHCTYYFFYFCLFAVFILSAAVTNISADQYIKYSIDLCNGQTFFFIKLYINVISALPQTDAWVGWESLPQTGHQVLCLCCTIRNHCAAKRRKVTVNM